MSILERHYDHDQSSHGNWSTGAGLDAVDGRLAAYEWTPGTVANPDAAALDTYVTDGHYEMNAFLRDGTPLTFTDEADIARLKAAIADAEPVTEEITVYRGIDRSALGDLEYGQQYADPGFMSTTTDAAMADRFGDTVVEITVPAGTQAIVGAADEFEVILQAGSTFNVNEATSWDLTNG